MALTPKQTTFALGAREAMAEFYADPDNEREFQEWLREREAAEAEERGSEEAGECRE